MIENTTKGTKMQYTVDDDSFKAILHTDESFQAYLEHQGSAHTRERLQQMNMKLSTQIATFGNERPAWFKKAKGLLTVVRVRQDEVKEYELLAQSDWKSVAEDLVEVIRERLDIQSVPEWNTVDDLDDWLNQEGL